MIICKCEVDGNTILDTCEEDVSMAEAARAFAIGTHHRLRCGSHAPEEYRVFVTKNGIDYPKAITVTIKLSADVVIGRGD